jgi:hypothetical protein
MPQAQSTMPAPIPIPLTPRDITPSAEAGKASHPVLEIIVYSPGPVPCRCGRYLSEDFNGRLFCRGCEGTDSSDITPRLPLCHRRP